MRRTTREDDLRQPFDRGASEDRLAAARAAMANTPDEAWKSYLKETRVWDEAECSDFDEGV